MTQVCPVCFAHCHLPDGGVGRCKARINKDNKIIPAAYGRLTALALDPIEKKPLNRFYPGTFILSAGSYGCNLRCPFCQNHEISMHSPQDGLKVRYMDPAELVKTAVKLKDRGNIGIAFTYNEPMINHEYVYDTAVLAKREGLKMVLVTNGTAEHDILEPMLEYIDAMNIDLKGFTEAYYREFLQGDISMVKSFITLAAEHCHVELTTLIIPGHNDSDDEMRSLCEWVLKLPKGADIPLHISRYFPAYKMTDQYPTPVTTVYHLKDIASEYLRYVYTGNC